MALAEINIEAAVEQARAAWAKMHEGKDPDYALSDDAQAAFLRWAYTKVNKLPPGQNVDPLLEEIGDVFCNSLFAAMSAFLGEGDMASAAFFVTQRMTNNILAFMANSVPGTVCHLPRKGDA